VVTAQFSNSGNVQNNLREPAFDQALYLALLVTLTWKRLQLRLRPLWQRPLRLVGDPLVAAILSLGILTLPGWILTPTTVSTDTTAIQLTDTSLTLQPRTRLTANAVQPPHQPHAPRVKSDDTGPQSVSLKPRYHSEMQVGGYAPRWSKTELVSVRAEHSTTRTAPSVSSDDRLRTFTPDHSLWGVISQQQSSKLTHESFPHNVDPGLVVPLSNPAGRLAIFTPVLDDNFYTVMLDPGHGGSDPGTIGVNGLLEKHVTLNIAERVQHLLAAHPNIRVALTRNSDTGYTRNIRLLRVRHVNPDVLVSLHLNNLPQRDLTLVESYYAAEHNITTSESGNAKNVRPRFTRTRAPRTQDYSFIQGSKQLAHILQEKIFSAVSQGNPAAQNAGTKEDTLYMLTQTYVPATLIELTCLSNSEEEIRLRTPEYRQQIATAIASGILEYFSQSPLPVDT